MISRVYDEKNCFFFNLIDHETATKILAACNSITKYFKTSHICNSLLTESAKILKIKGGRLKCFIKTRWTSMYEITYSIVRMRWIFDEVIFISFLCYFIYYIKNFN
jgi:hypothetical protein